MREIGGYFGLEELPSHEYHHEAVAVNSARNGLAYLIRALKIRKLHIPYYLCDSVGRLCEREHCEYGRYEISEDFQPVFKQESLADGEWLYIVNYFGQVANELQWQKDCGNIIVDNVQAFFRKPRPKIPTLYSCRKFFGVPDGGYVYSPVVLHDLSVDVSRERMRHILGRYEGRASDYYQDFQRNDEDFYDLDLRLMSRLTHNILGSIDYVKVKETREGNYACLHRRLGSANRLELSEPEGPYAYPFYCQNGLEVKRQLAKQGIYVPTLWPDAVPFGGLAKDYSENILPLPCDQRYTLEDMEYLSDILMTLL
jgi:hypothetical protein